MRLHSICKRQFGRKGTKKNAHTQARARFFCFSVPRDFLRESLAALVKEKLENTFKQAYVFPSFPFSTASGTFYVNPCALLANKKKQNPL